MTTPNDEPLSDYDLARVKGYGTRYGLKLTQSEADGLFARLAKAEAERDAAVAALEAERFEIAAQLSPAIAEGERRERAAIVAWLRHAVLGGDGHQSVNDTHAEAADAISRGDHITEAKP